MKIRAKVPLRVSFFGGGSDIPPYCDIKGGEILFCTINKYTYCEIEDIPDKQKIILGDEEVFEEHEDYSGQYGIVKAVLHELKIRTGCRITIHSDVQQGTGLGGSSSQMAAVILACYKWEGKEITKRELAKKAYYMERIVMKIKGGYQDPITTVYGGIGYLKVKNIDEFHVERFTMSEKVIEDLRQHLLLYYTGIQHNSAEIMKEQIKGQENHKMDNEQLMSVIKKLAEEARVELEQGELLRFGMLLKSGWENKKKMCNQISSGYIDGLYEKAIKAGALGGKILGAGGGGYLLLFSEIQNRTAVEKMFAMEKGVIDRDWDFDFLGARLEE